MLFSMTGFGAGSITQDDHTVQVEIRSLNSKFLELGMKLPASDASLENDIILFALVGTSIAPVL